jgi:phosphonate transport system permease protein
VNRAQPHASPRGGIAGDPQRIAAALATLPRRNALSATIALGLLAGAAGSLALLDITWSRFVTGLGKLGELLFFMLPPSTGGWPKALVYLDALGETVAIALLGTLLAALLAFPVGFMAAKNVMTQRLVHFSSRRFLDTVRGVDELIWALIWINVVGLGPFAGVLAIATANFGAFGKLFSEAIEAADRRPVEGVRSTGGSALHAARFGLMPEVLPVIISQVLYYFESNTRSATIIGIVGAGGIGLHLAEQIRILEYQHVSAMILMILVAVAVIDALSTRLRSTIVDGRSTLA